MIQYIKETSLDDFPAWGGARDTLDTIRKAGKISQVEEFISEMFSGRIPTADDINDLLWFDDELIFRAISIEEE